ncbi:CaiB/BaiF CoA transferase family protein [Streptomyces uncialis]|uniref:CaiB/BaiF CoA transferase family protein n=1 Tax=Streptomyces uncialis TaxID=1048205 RepID=UPI0037FE1118
MRSWAAEVAPDTPSAPGGPSAAGPLTGLVVVDLSRMLAGPFCTMVLADLGATVIKVEPPFGDLTRPMGPFVEGDGLKAFGGYFQSVNRNKRGMVVDLTRPGGADVVRRLVTTADVLVENYRPGVMERHGLGYESLAELNPRLVYTAVRGFGDPRTGRSPYQDWPSYDIVAQAMGGLLGITGPVGGPPVKTGPGLGDILPAIYAAVGTLAAVREREITGRGRFVDVSMYDAVLAACERIVYQHSYGGTVPGPEGNGHPILSPFDVFPARDGWIAVAAPSDNHWIALCEIIGRPELGEDPRFRTNFDRSRHSGEVRRFLGEWTAGRTRGEITEVLGGRVPVGAVNTAETILADPHVRARGMLHEVEQPGVDHPVTIAAGPIRFAGSPRPPAHRAPLLGEHTADILREAGCTAEDIEHLLRTGAVR